ncbi:MAG: TetR/AcrR family transcriptional regulator [Intrasporangium sp.]|uniref:TetR/AcrR family transcriptional regulator n=1 Tax=Intrasporangium sp. TaxID=1925024 RepID=UPI002648C3D4|nr:TetR/AcrR family transcriptional regulator [Intrasporangium sp.]MDN5797909.1 TetR/AcrR family transcriptional regulator [Intrasporangium sp.]
MTAGESAPATAPGGHRAGRPQGTREQILEVALRRFTEQGYNGTSLREIAEELGVTKAALYYHFRTKEQILQSLLSTLQEQLRALADWADRQEPGEATREELLGRTVDLALGPASRVMAMAQQNQNVLRELAPEHEQDGPPIELFQRIIAPLLPPGAGYEEAVRARTAVFSIVAGTLLSRDLQGDVDPDERRAVALRIAHDVLRSPAARGRRRAAD